MTKLPDITDPTLDAVDRAIEARENDSHHRPYLGMSAIGDPCARKLWYGFRWTTPKQFDAATLKRFADGHLGEDVQADRLRLVEGIELHTHTPEGKQFGFVDHAGHFRGHMDGAIHGLIQSPKTWHVWEHKQTGDKKQQKLAKLKAEKSEKSALAAWDEIYYAQAVLYMDYSGMSRHYLTCATPGGRTTVSCRTEEDGAAAIRLKAKASNIIASDSPLDKISESPGWYQCKWCDHFELCHGQATAEVNCRTCLHATPEQDGDGRWSCARSGQDLPIDKQRTGCTGHLYVPGILSNIAEQVDADEHGVKYRNKLTDCEFWNGQGEGRYSSAEIHAAKDKRSIGYPDIDAMKSELGGEVVG